MINAAIHSRLLTRFIRKVFLSLKLREAFIIYASFSLKEKPSNFLFSFHG